MSATKKQTRLTTRDLSNRTSDNPIVALTAYTSSIAKILDRHCDMLLVGDSLGMVLYGLDSTLAVTLDMMSLHGAAVVRSTSHSCVIVDMPFGSYQESNEAAFRSASRLMAETGCGGVKLEGGAEMAPTIKFLVERGIPVMGHIGLRPQAVHSQGGFRAQGRTESEASQIILDAKAVESAGAFATVLEGTLEPIARKVLSSVNIPVIGIGASPECAGQILVTDDLVGLFSDFTPKFVKRYANLSDEIDKAVEAYAHEVKSKQFPTLAHCFGAK